MVFHAFNFIVLVVTKIYAFSLCIWRNIFCSGKVLTRLIFNNFFRNVLSLVVYKLVLRWKLLTMFSHFLCLVCSVCEVHCKHLNSWRLQSSCHGPNILFEAFPFSNLPVTFLPTWLCLPILLLCEQVRFCRGLNSC